MPTDAYDHDAQDNAEVFDEDNLDDDDTGPNAHEFKTFEELPEVFDATQRQGDRDDGDALDEVEFTDGAIDDEDLEDDPLAELSAEEDPYGLEEVTAAPDEVELAYEDVEGRRGAQASAAHFESRGELSEEDLRELGYVDQETGEPR